MGDAVSFRGIQRGAAWGAQCARVVGGTSTPLPIANPRLTIRTGQSQDSPLILEVAGTVLGDGANIASFALTPAQTGALKPTTEAWVDAWADDAATGQRTHLLPRPIRFQIKESLEATP